MWCAGLRLFPAFPYEPYPIQQDFMQALYEAIDKGQIGLFESPTGSAAMGICALEDTVKVVARSSEHAGEMLTRAHYVQGLERP